MCGTAFATILLFFGRKGKKKTEGKQADLGRGKKRMEGWVAGSGRERKKGKERERKKERMEIFPLKEGLLPERQFAEQNPRRMCNIPSHKEHEASPG